MRKQWIVALAAVLAACSAPAQQAVVQQPAPFDPVGVYDFATEVQGTVVRGVLTLNRTEQGLSGSISTDITGMLPLSSVTVEGRRASLRASTTEGNLIMHLDFLEDARIQGGWELSSGLGGSVAGQRRPD